jgi:glutaminyl-tRNA synthetase
MIFLIIRIKHSSHPHTGHTWCIYPTYDFTHCINDSLENITHSLCTLEFEIRRDSYYWLLEALNLYRPHVWEYSRLNITRNILSKRKLTILVNKGLVNGWDDPRLLTLNGLRRRGYTPQSINEFVDQIGVTRRGNENIVSVGILENSLRKILDSTSPRTLAILDPIKVILENLDDKYSQIIEVLNFPKDPTKGKNTINLKKNLFIDRCDFKEKDEEDFYGLALNKETGLKYAGTILCKEIKKNKVGNVEEIICEYKDEMKKTKGRINWISADEALNCEVRFYDYLFKSENPNECDNFLDDLNPNSLVVYRNSLINTNLLEKLVVGVYLQFERIGYFILDKDSNILLKKFVFNLSVELGNKKINKV